MAILLQQRLVQIQRVPKLCEFAGRSSLTEHLLHGIAGDNMNHQEHQREHQPKRRKCKQKSLAEVPRDLQERFQERTPVGWVSFFFPRGSPSAVLPFASAAPAAVAGVPLVSPPL